MYVKSEIATSPKTSITSNDSSTDNMGTTTIIYKQMDQTKYIHVPPCQCVTVQPIKNQQNINTRSSMETELMWVGNIITQVLQIQHLLDAQVYTVQYQNIMQDNQISVFLENN